MPFPKIISKFDRTKINFLFKNKKYLYKQTIKFKKLFLLIIYDNKISFN